MTVRETWAPVPTLISLATLKLEKVTFRSYGFPGARSFAARAIFAASAR
ncbi:hypothetical protein SGLAM104S_08186 [Streptomyces glaucescens]